MGWEQRCSCILHPQLTELEPRVCNLKSAFFILFKEIFFLFWVNRKSPYTIKQILSLKTFLKFNFYTFLKFDFYTFLKFNFDTLLFLFVYTVRIFWFNLVKVWEYLFIVMGKLKSCNLSKRWGRGGWGEKKIVTWSQRWKKKTNILQKHTNAYFEYYKFFFNRFHEQEDIMWFLFR